MLLKSLFFKIANLFERFLNLEDALKLQRFNEEKLIFTAEHETRCLLELDLDMFMKVVLGGGKSLDQLKFQFFLFRRSLWCKWVV